MWYVENRNMNYCGVFHWDDVRVVGYGGYDRGSQATYYHHLYESEIPNNCSMLLGMHDAYNSKAGTFAFHFRKTSSFKYDKNGSLN